GSEHPMADPTVLTRARMELAARLSGPRLLLVEDSDLAAAITADVLAEAGYRVTRAGDGAAALEALERDDFELVVTDRVMPGMAGRELGRGRRAQPATTGIHVLMLTAADQKHQIVEGLAAGADDYLTKPFDRAELLARVRAGLRLAALQQELAEA